jgi:phenylalanine-4-hydroxylase
MESRGGYSPVITTADGSVEVHLEADHPGFSDPVYRERRNDIARLSLNYTPGDPIPYVEYSDVEHHVWNVVSHELSSRHDQFASNSFRNAKQLLALPTESIPQLTDVSKLLEPISGFSYQPVAGLAPLRDFYGSFARRSFFSTQYIRHPSAPQYTPEPDIIHEVVGHANQLADPRIAQIYLAVGNAVQRSETPGALEFLSRVFWFTLEFGVVMHNNEPKAYGAGILSSVGELDTFQSATILPLDFVEMGRERYDITKFQPVLFSLGSEAEMFDRLLEFYSDYGDSYFEQIAASS